jgi:tight adherence protein C
MLIYLAATLVAVSVVGLVLLAGQLVPGRPEMIRRLEEMPGTPGVAAAEQRRRAARAERLRRLLAALGTRAHGTAEGPTKTQQLLLSAGFVSPIALRVFYGARLAAAFVAAFLFLSLSPAIGDFLGVSRPIAAILALAWGTALGWVTPTMIVASRARTRKRQMLKTLPDAIDLLVVCVEAGLGLNQALLRVAEEIGLISPVLGEQMGLVNLEIRAGTPREEALRAFGTRTDLDDARSLATVLIQTDRFGTSVAQALRTHAEDLRVRRRQRIEEASAKTSIKMLFPLVFCIFPALFIVLLGPGILEAMRVLGDL